MSKQSYTHHIPVLLHEVIDGLDPQVGDRYLDLTAGYGGHASEVLQRTKADAVLVDRDENAVEQLKQTFSSSNEVHIEHGDFMGVSQTLAEKGESFDLILADLGVSSPHLDKQERGFSLQHNGPLDMRMDPSQSLTAADVVNTWAREELIRIEREYGEEPKAAKIADLIIEHRPIETTQELAQIVSKAWPGHSRVHPATRTFQAIRIAVNDELGQLERSLPLWLKMLRPGGRIAVISFHSLEDALVKRFFKEHSGNRYDAELVVMTKKPVTAANTELVSNPRARSARLRVSKRK